MCPRPVPYPFMPIPLPHLVPLLVPLHTVSLLSSLLPYSLLRSFLTRTFKCVSALSYLFNRFQTTVYVLFYCPLTYLTLLQGLPTTVTACLFIVAERMGRHNVFIKKLDIIETLGSCTLICTGKHIMIKHIILYQSGHTFLCTHDQLIGSSITSSSPSVLWILSKLLASLNQQPTHKICVSLFEALD